MATADREEKWKTAQELQEIIVRKTGGSPVEPTTTTRETQTETSAIVAAEIKKQTQRSRRTREHAGRQNDHATSSEESDSSPAPSPTSDLLPGESDTAVNLYRPHGGSWTLKKPHRALVVPHIARDAAIVLRWTESSPANWRLSKITVQSPHIRSVLKKVFEDCPEINTELEDLSFSAPFHEFFFRWSRLQELETEDFNHKTVQHMLMLRDAIQSVLGTEMGRAADLMKHESVEFDVLWTLFEAGSEVYTEISGEPALAIVDSFRSVEDQQGCRSGVVQCRGVDFDGKALGYRSFQKRIPIFEGIKAIADLPIYPSHIRSDIDVVRIKLEARAKRFLNIYPSSYMQYSGSFDEVSSGYATQYMEVGRVVVDARGFAEYNPAHSPSLDRLDTDNGKKLAKNRHDKTRVLDDEDYYDDRRLRFPSYPSNNDTSFDIPEKEDISMKLPEELLRYCVPFVRGFNLATKSWCIFSIKAIQNIDWNDTAFNKLMLRQEYKTMILAFVHSHLRSQDNFDDVIKGKGQSFVMLLGGEPGTGKTLTAESVAEEMKSPLYSLSAGELGTYSDDVEKSLRRVLDLCAKWHAVLLVDECDVFLEQRSVSDLERNKLVSVFLRLLEYYKGVMILTTNRESTIDVAFKSRIHLTIHYPKLVMETRRRIWQNFIEPAAVDSVSGDIGISPNQFDILAKEDLNGREIKSVVRAARLLSSYYGVPLSFEHLITVIKVKNEEQEGRTTTT